MANGLIKLYDHSGTQEIDTISADYEDPITLESFRAHIKEHRLSPSKGTKSFIIARVTTLGTGPDHKEYYSYYSASCLNKIIFQKQTSGQKTTVVRREAVQNPLTNTNIVGNIVYFVVKPNHIIQDISNTAITGTPGSKLAISNGLKVSNEKRNLCNGHVVLCNKQQESDISDYCNAHVESRSLDDSKSSPPYLDAKIEIFPVAIQKSTASNPSDKPIVTRIYERFRIGKVKPTNTVEFPRKNAECGSKSLKYDSFLSPDALNARDSFGNYPAGDSQSSVQGPQSAILRDEECCITSAGLRNLTPNIYPKLPDPQDDYASSDSIYEAIAFATDTAFLKSSAVRKFFEDNAISSDDSLYELNSHSAHNDSPDVENQQQDVANSSPHVPLNYLRSWSGGVGGTPPIYFIIIVVILVSLEAWALISNYRISSMFKKS